MPEGILLSAPASGGGLYPRATAGATGPYSLAAETMPRWAANASTLAPTAGTVFAIRIHLLPGDYTTVTYFKAAVQGATIANAFFALFNTDGATRLSVSADVAASMEAVGTYAFGTATLATSIPTEGDYYLAILIGSAGTVPQFAGANTASVNLLYNHPPILHGQHNVGSLTAIPATITLTAVSQRYLWLKYA